ncbi:hypothetical protein SLA2020_476560 [Shorea laevis]
MKSALSSSLASSELKESQLHFAFPRLGSASGDSGSNTNRRLHGVVFQAGASQGPACRSVAYSACHQGNSFPLFFSFFCIISLQVEILSFGFFLFLFLLQFKIGICQLPVTPDKERNMAHALKAIEEAAEKGAQLVLLPEIWNSPCSNDSFPVYAEDIDAGGDASPSTVMLSEVSRRLKITIVGGSIPERYGDKLYNTCCVFGSDGKLKVKHRKIHLFDIDIPGEITFTESETLTAGESLTIVDTDVGRIGIGICYDIQFQELAMIYAARGAHLLCFPGAFNLTTGPLHWELMQRRRATDNQLYVATCSPARDIEAGYVAWGHSTIVGPFGEVLATTVYKEDIIIAEIDYSVIEQRRASLPLTKQMRGDLYQLVDIQKLHS